MRLTRSTAPGPAPFPTSFADGRGCVSARDDQLLNQEPILNRYCARLAQPVMVKETVRSALPPGGLIAVGFHLSVPIDDKADEKFVSRRRFDIERHDIVKVPPRLRQKVAVPSDEIGVARQRLLAGEREGHVLIIEMSQVELVGRGMLKMGEPVVDEPPKVVRVRRGTAVLRFEA